MALGLAVASPAVSQTPPDSVRRPPIRQAPRDSTHRPTARSTPRDSTRRTAPPETPLDSAASHKRFPFWPDSVRGPVARTGAILPFKRIVAFYGNPLSTKMGILGQLPPDKMFAKLE